jgi:hypothetical protein
MLLHKIDLATAFGHRRYETSLAGKAPRIEGRTLHPGQGAVEIHLSDGDGVPLFAKLIRTIRYVKPDIREHSLAPEVSLGSPETTAEATPNDTGISDDSTTIQAESSLGEVGRYLWEVHQRAPTKRDGSGDFTWKDQTAAKRLGMSMPEYVIGGMDPGFREELYDAGRAMDLAGIKWAILAAFRDDYRQSLASGFKASARNSLHGGSIRTGGYGHGRAVDVTSTDGDPQAVWNWIDAHGAKFGLRRPMPGADPGHVQSRGDWHKLTAALRQVRIKNGPINEATSGPATRTKLIASTSR